MHQPASPYAETMSMLEAARIQLRVIAALVLREMRTRFGMAKIGYLWALLEPLGHVAILSLVYAILGRRSPVGTNLELFFITGLFPYFLFDKTLVRLTGALGANKALLHLPVVKNADVIVARAILELATTLSAFLLVLAALFAMGTINDVHIDVLTLASAMLVAWLLGLGLGGINAVMSTLFKSWEGIFRILTRPLYLLSGVFFMVEKMPPPLNTILLYNPVLHCIEWFRSAFYPGYGRFSLDKGYVLTWAIAAVIIAFALERLLRRQLSAKAS